MFKDMILDLLWQNVIAINLDIGFQGMIIVWKTFKHLPFVHCLINDTTTICKTVSKTLKTNQILWNRLRVGVFACIGKIASC